MLKLGLGPGWLQRSGAGAGTTTVFALFGQSNSIGRAPFDGGAVHPGGVRQWGRVAPNDGVLIPASIPLEHHDPNPGEMGLDITFSLGWTAQNPGATLVYVPAGDGGTSLLSGYWRKGGAGYEDAVARLNAVMLALPEATFGGFLWHQGESDAGNVAYAGQLDQMIADFRTDVAAAGPETPFVLGLLSPDWVAQDTARTDVQDTIEATPLRVSHTAVASSLGLSGPDDALHFDAASLRVLGSRYVSALTMARTGQGGSPAPAGSIPTQLDFITGGGLSAPLAQGQIPDQTDEVAV